MLRKLTTLLVLSYLISLFAEVTVNVTPNDKSLSFKWQSTSALPYYLGGVRFYTDGYVHPGLSSMTNWVFTQKDVGGEKEQTILYKSSIATVQVVNAGGQTTAATLGDWSGKEVKGAKRSELLLKTGSAGKVDDPITEDPIDTSDIDSLIKTPNFYNEDYRYIDTLGAHGGLYSGGIMDTWLGQTQVICHFSDKTWPIHGTEQASFKLSATGGDPLFWMSVIMGQEYFNVDMQWMLGKGAQETGAGTGSYNGTNGEGAFGPWEVETGTGKSREQAYPYFFEHGTIGNFWSDADSPLNSANVVNGYIYSIVCVRYMYDLWNYATDACWKEILVESASRYYALSILLGGYNNGIGDAQNVLKPFWHVDTYKTYVNDPNGHDAVEAVMNKGYVPGVIGGVKNLEEGSKAAYTDKSLELIDMELSLTDIKRFFYGDGGDHNSQGDGGLLAHFDVDRDKFNVLIETAFRKLKGRAPSTQGKEAISLRYDFLTLLRVVKRDFQITWVRPTGPGEWITAVKEQSKKGGCDTLEFDEEYPYGEVDGAPEFIDDFKVDIHGWDNQMIEEVLWTMDPEWKKWNKATYKSGSDDDQIFTITIPRADIKTQFGDNTGTYWYMVSDASGNSVVKKDIIKGNPLKYAAAKDYNGDGFADSIKVLVVKGALEDDETVGGFDELKYSWPVKSNLTTTSDVEVNDSLLMIHTLYDNAGAGLGNVTVKYPSMTAAAEREVLDSVGPAVTYASLFEGVSEDSLLIVPSEEVTNISSKDYEYLFLIKGSDETKEKSKEVVSLAKDTLLFLFEKNIVSDKDSVRFNFDSELRDLANIKPQTNNKRILIKKNGSLEPILDSAIALDTKGDGMADKIEIHLTPSTYSGSIPVSNYKDMKYSWPTKNNLKAPDDIQQKDNTLTLTDDELTEGAGLGKVTFSYGTATYNNDVDDRVGPAITKAVLFIQDSDRDRDTLMLTISEALTENNKKNHAYLFLNESLKENSEEVIKKSDTEYWFIFPKDLVFNRDSVKFTFDNNPVKDAVGNAPLDINQWIPIQVLGGKEPTLDSAYIVDTDGNGDGDSIIVELLLGASKDQYTVDSISAGRYSWPETDLANNIAPGTFTEKSDKSFSFLYDSDKGAGTGALELKFPEEYTLTGAINDAVGPVIDSAICLQKDLNRDADTLILETSELLSENFTDNNKYLILFEDSTDTEGDTISVSTVAIDGDQYRFIVAKDIVSYGDWIQFVHNSGIEDQKKNSPLTINQKVQINVLGGTVPSIKSAEIYDIFGTTGRIDGNGDSIFVSLVLADDPKALTTDSLKEVSYTWGGTTESKPVSDITVLSNNSLSLVDKSLIGGNGSGSVTLTFKNGAAITKSITDKVAPVISKASYYKWSGEKDTLVITFSEEISNSGSNSPFTVTGNTITVREQSTNGNTAIYSIENGAELFYNDSIWITGSEEITDKEDNEQNNSNNVKIPLEYKNITTITEAAYFEKDERPDGYIDCITLYSATSLKDVSLDALKDAIVLPTERFISIKDITKANDTTIVISCSQNTDQAAPITSIESFDKIGMSMVSVSDTLAFSKKEDISVKDSLAPVIVSARFIAGSEEQTPLIDTLKITYSEEVQRSTSDEPFRFSDESDGDNEYSLEFKNDKGGKSEVTYLNEYKQTNVLPGLGDSIWIHKGGEIEDKSSITQEKNSVPVPLTVGTYNRNYKISIAPLPFNLENFEDSMVTIRIQPRTRMLPADIQASFAIFDKVGNLIKEVGFDAFGEVEDEMLKHSFKPQNQSERKLGHGTYQIELLIKADGEVTKHPLKLGISEKSLN